ncbi:hypothetical protein A8C56_10025 [Niabella ginsenosidivorans]|uniref:PDZ domain-containing protein n=1 Tax=Niabella ginsenosidivorans TaxID=1176587 RepID=A0A1A9I0V4_9BACT|nr:S41 family peptidase [Niabella ginsenosidivorans]ANH81278.1 hypothetical protein A8C56_10025 [Niabella ginsenosidivorans]
MTLFTACSRKDKNSNVTTSALTTQHLLADSLFLYAKQIYYWNTALPDQTAFQPDGYVQSDTLSGLQSELLALTRYPKNPATGLPYEQAIYYDDTGVARNDNTQCKYSYIEKTADLYGGGLTSVIADPQKTGTLKMTLDGKENELGFAIGFIPVSLSADTKEKIPYSDKDSSVAYVRFVTKGSPAYNAGLRRGQIISKFNGNRWSYDNNSAQITNALNGSSITLTIYKPSKDSSWDISFSKSLYTFNPVYKDTVLNIAGKKIGYIAFKSFTSPANAQPALDESFGKFNGITDIVVDLRYNGGGYVETATYFANLLAPASATGKVLFAEYYNQLMQQGQATLLKNQPVYDDNNSPRDYTYFDIDYSVSKNTAKIAKTGNVNSSSTIKNIYFIVSSATASASELLINCLRPYFNSVYLIGAAFSDDGTKTYGKPVGFFEIRLGKYSAFLANFETKNASQLAGTQTDSYYDGMTTNLQKFDDVRYDFGDPNELCLLYAIRQITGNSSYIPAQSQSRAAFSGISSSDDNIRLPIGHGIGTVTTIHDMITTPDQKSIRR